MMKRPPLFKVLDNFLFKQVDRYTTSQAHQKIDDTLSPLSEPAQKVINHGTTLFLIILPIIISLVMIYSNHKLAASNDHLNKTLELIEEIKQSKRQIEAMSARIISNGNLNSQAELEGKLRALNNKGTKVNVISFDSITSGGLNQAVSTLKFQALTLQDLRTMIETLQMRERMKINRLTIERENSSKKLQGELEITHFSKVLNENDEVNPT